MQTPIYKNTEEAKLKAGDANLMSILLATPVGLEAWDRFQEGQAKGD